MLYVPCAEYADFVSFGTNDLTHTTFGISRDDAETGFLIEYMGNEILRTTRFPQLTVRAWGN